MPAKLSARIAAPAALVVLAGAGIAVAVTTVGSSAVAGSAERTVTVTRGVVQSTVSGSGSLAPANQLDLTFGASGEVLGIYVKPGEHVSAGQLLAKIDPSSAEVDLAEARATLQSARDALASAQSGGTATVSADAHAGAVVHTIALTADDSGVPADGAGAEPTAQANATALAKAKAKALAKAKAKALARAKAAAKAKAATETERAAPAGGGSARSGGGGSGAAAGASAGGGSSGAATSVASATAAVKSAELSVAKAEKALAATKLRAPMAGTVAEVNGAVGDTVGSSASASSGAADAGSTAAGAEDGAGADSGSGFITLAQVSRFRMEVSLSESDVGKVKAGQAATVTVNAVSGTELAAHVERVGVLAASDSSSGAVSYPVTLKLDQRATKLRAGMSATADIVVAQASGLTLPSQAVTGSSVTVVRDGERTTQRVQTGVVGESSTQILSGLQEGDEVIVRSASAAAGASAGAAGQGGQGNQTGGFGRGGGGGGGAFPGAGLGGGGPVLRTRPGGAGP